MEADGKGGILLFVNYTILAFDDIALQSKLANQHLDHTQHYFHSHQGFSVWVNIIDRQHFLDDMPYVHEHLSRGRHSIQYSILAHLVDHN